MRTAPLLLAFVALAGCERDNPRAADEIVGHRWARTLAECGDTYLDFSRDTIAFVRDGQPVNSLPVRRVVREAGSSTVMFVIEVDGALAAGGGAPRGASDVAMAFRVDGDSLKLVGQGAPDGLLRGMMGDKSYSGFTLRRCP